MIIGLGRMIGPGGSRGWSCPICGTNYPPGVMDCAICNDPNNWIAYPPVGNLTIDETQEPNVS